jgi:hypothetical protein
MKKALLAICILGSTAAFAQYAGGSLSAQPQVYSFASHEEHASRRPLRTTEILNGDETVVSAQGERSLWEVATPVHEVPLGDSARTLRLEHAATKKAAKVWQN